MPAWFVQFEPMLLQSVANSFLPGIVFLLLAMAILRMLRSVNAASRYAIHLSCLIAIFMLFLSGLRIPSQPPELPAVAAQAIPIATQPADAWQMPSFSVSGTVALALTLLWVSIAGWKTMRIVRCYYFLQSWKKSCSPLPDSLQLRLQQLRQQVGIREEVYGAVSTNSPLPVTLGLGRPVILIPEEILHNLTPDDLDHILLHELTHILRKDDFTRLAQKIVEAVLFFHPATYLLGKRLDLDREVACDDLVILQTGMVRPYARCLTKLAGSQQRLYRPMLAAGLLPGGSQLSRRIDMLLNSKRTLSSGISKSVLFAALTALLLLVGVFAYTKPLIAVTLREQGLQHLDQAKQEMQAAEQEMLRAADEKQKAADEQALARAEMKAQAAQMQMQSARARLDAARAEIHQDAVESSYAAAPSEPATPAEPAPSAPPAPAQAAIAPPHVAAAPRAEAAPQIAVAPSAAARALPALDAISCPIERKRVQEQIRKQQEEIRKQQEEVRKVQETRCREIEQKALQLSMKKITVTVPEVNVHVHAMNLKLKHQNISIPEMNVDIPESQIDVPVIAPDTTN